MDAEPPRTPPRSEWIPTASSRHLRGRKTINTGPELTLRKKLHKLGFRYRLHVRLARACTPDILLPRYGLAIFVDGCLWHGCTRHGTVQFKGPNAHLWEQKIRTNRQRDERATAAAEQAGWHVLRVWECDIRHDLDTTAMNVARLARENEHRRLIVRQEQIPLNRSTHSRRGKTDPGPR
jgi:DNA mismatch endonuclease (patch repair protein)